MRHSQEEWDKNESEVEEDTKEPLSQRRFLNATLGIVSTDEHHFEEDLENALIYSNPQRFIQLRARSCRISVERVDGYDPVAYLRGAIERVERYVDSVKTNGGLQSILYNQTRAAIIKGINQLIQEYQQRAPATSTLPPADQSPAASDEPLPATYETFADLFRDPADIDKCVEVLNSYEAGKRRDGTFYKYVLVIWVEYLYSVDKIRTNKPELVAPVLANELGETVARRTFYETPEPVKAEHAKEYFRHNIPHKPH